MPEKFNPVAELQKLIPKHGGNMEQFARWLGVSSKTVSRIVSGEQEIGRKVASLLEKRTGIAAAIWLGLSSNVVERGEADPFALSRAEVAIAAVNLDLGPMSPSEKAEATASYEQLSKRVARIPIESMIGMLKAELERSRKDSAYTTAGPPSKARQPKRDSDPSSSGSADSDREKRSRQA